APTADTVVTTATSSGASRSSASPSRLGSPSTRSGPHSAPFPTAEHRAERDWERLSASWRPRLDAQIAMLERLRDRLTGCIGCGCLSMKACKLLNPGDLVAERGPGPRYVLDDD